MQTASPTAVLSSGPLTVFTLAAVRRTEALLNSYHRTRAQRELDGLETTGERAK